MTKPRPIFIILLIITILLAAISAKAQPSIVMHVTAIGETFPCLDEATSKKGVCFTVDEERWGDSNFRKLRADTEVEVEFTLKRIPYSKCSKSDDEFSIESVTILKVVEQ
jgi:hypothetical protein